MPVASTPNPIVSTDPRACPATSVPNAEPISSDGAQCPKVSLSTAPRRACARPEVIAVGRMLAREVPSTRCMRMDSSTPRNANNCRRNGTMTMPPPTPSMPATNPVNAPVTSNATAREASQSGP